MGCMEIQEGSHGISLMGGVPSRGGQTPSANMDDRGRKIEHGSRIEKDQKPF